MSADGAPPLVEVRDLHKEYLLPRDSLLAPPRRVHAVRDVAATSGWSGNRGAASPPWPAR